MLHSSRLHGQDGFIREILWVALAIAIVAVVLLDGMAIFNTRQSLHDDVTTAATEARTEYAQSLDQQAAKIAAEQYLTKSGVQLVKFSAASNDEGQAVMTVTAKDSTDTYVFKYLRYVPGLDEWVQKTTHPSATGTSE